MSREIKFRAWEHNRKVMIPWVDLLGFSVRGAFLDYELVVMQYTGLKDKNGKEIYEGDIFRAPHDFGPAGFETRTGVVKWHETQGYQWNYWLLEELEVVGNIYEDPELLGEGNLNEQD